MIICPSASSSSSSTRCTVLQRVFVKVMLRWLTVTRCRSHLAWSNSSALSSRTRRRWSFIAWISQTPGDELVGGHRGLVSCRASNRFASLYLCISAALCLYSSAYPRARCMTCPSWMLWKHDMQESHWPPAHREWEVLEPSTNLPLLVPMRHLVPFLPSAPSMRPFIIRATQR